MTNKSPIGVYDSGVGGLTVLMALRKLLPQEDFIYFADTKHLPYGDKSVEQIKGYSHDIITWMQDDMKAKMVIAACNTSSAVALEDISDEFAVPIIGTIRPIIGCIANSDIYKRIGVIATPASVASRMHEKMFMKSGFNGVVESISCPEFVSFIESNQMSSAALKKVAAEYLDVFKQENLDTLIYGCTHYPFIKNVIEALLPVEMQYIDPAEYISLEVKKALSSSDMLNDSGGEMKFYSSSDPEIFTAKLKLLTGIDGVVYPPKYIKLLS